MNFRKIKRICDVRGCKNIDCFVIARSREVGNSVIICKDCLSKALEAVKGYIPEPKKESTGAPPPLFFNTPAETVEPVEEQKFICPECGNEFKSAAGLQSHMRTHKGDE